MRKPTTDRSDTARNVQHSIEACRASLDRLDGDAEHTARLATLGTLAAGIAHEINNILTPVLALAQMASTRPHDRELCNKALARTVQGVELASRVADAVLGLASRNPDGEADVGRAAQAALDCIAFNPNKTRIQLSIEVQSGTVVHISPMSLQQVLMNLFLNAIAAMRVRGGKLTVAAVPRSDGTVMIRVSDTGPGIAKEIAGRIFEPFVTTKRSRSGHSTRGESGTGLGLALCRRLIEGAGGTITATSKAGEGTSFHIILPNAAAVRAKAS